MIGLHETVLFTPKDSPLPLEGRVVGFDKDAAQVKLADGTIKHVWTRKLVLKPRLTMHDVAKLSAKAVSVEEFDRVPKGLFIPAHRLAREWGKSLWVMATWGRAALALRSDGRLLMLSDDFLSREAAYEVRAAPETLEALFAAHRAARWWAS